MSNIFEDIKALLPMSLVFQSYGIEINRGGFCLCPFHSENHASCRIYDNNYIHCYGCGEHHDIISFTAKYFNLSNQFDAVKKLNKDFHLGLDTDSPLLPAEKSEYIKKAEEKNAYAAWEQSAWKTLRDWYRLLMYYLEIYRPSCTDEYNSYFALALTELPLAEIYLEEYSDTAYENRKKVFSSIVNDISAKLKKHQ